MNEFAQVYEVEPRKARKAHKCVSCGGIIKAGEFYKYHHGVFDGSGFSDKVCTDCHDMINEINSELHPDDTISVSELSDAVFESDAATIKKFIENKIKRGCEIRPWMTERLNETPKGIPDCWA